MSFPIHATHPLLFECGQKHSKHWMVVQMPIPCNGNIGEEFLSVYSAFQVILNPRQDQEACVKKDNYCIQFI